MFTGLVESLGTVRAADDDGAGGKNLVLAASFAKELALGESVAINGCCLTVVAVDGDVCRFQVGPETLAKTNVGRLGLGDRVNLERSLRFGDRLGGHLVTGHVDGVGTIAERVATGEWQTVWFTGPAELMRLLVPKGCVAVDGVSLTVVDVHADRFSVMLIPHTLLATTLGIKNVGDAVNLEADLIGKYVAQCLTPYR
jgi:riboflavin synthase